MMKKWVISTIVLVGIAIMYTACGTDDTVLPIDFKNEYYPADTGQWIEYRVDSINYRYSAPEVFIDTFSWELREVITDTFLDNQGRITYRVERYRRPVGGTLWNIARVWSLNKFVDKLEKSEDEYRYIRLIFPPAVGKDWNGTVYFNTAEENISRIIRPGKDWTFEYTRVDDMETIGTETFDSTLTVVHVDDSNKIQLDLSYEIYAKNVGMIYKELRILDKQAVLNNWDQPEEGFILTYKVTDYKR